MTDKTKPVSQKARSTSFRHVHTRCRQASRVLPRFDPHRPCRRRQQSTRRPIDAALQGVDPKTGERLAQVGGRGREHSAGWDMTFSAPKSVSVLWALSEAQDRGLIEQAHRSAVLAATAQLEATTGWARRGRGGATRERTAGLLTAQFDHHTSRESDPQLHTHAFIFNLAPRRDGSWGAIVSRELYKVQKQAGATYRRALASGLERQGIRLERQNDTFRVAAIPRDVERAFSKRRQAVEEAAHTHGYNTPKGMELATLRTRRPKRDARLGDLIKHWQAEARALGFELGQTRQRMRTRAASNGRLHPTPSAGRHNAPSPAASARTAVAVAATNTDQQRAAQLGSRLGQAIRALDQPAGMSGVRIRLRYREREQE
jgi:conjugative relaxase-like TrwC/TraI family protein